MNKKLKQVINEALPNEKKVYCKDCKWKPLFPENYLSCYFPDFRRIKEKVHSFTLDENIIVREYRWQEEFNYHGKCSYYKRKWYKFWVK